MTEKSGKVNESQIDFLKPCPICGEEPDCVMGKDNLTDTTKFRVGCNRCKVYTIGSNGKEAQEMWNDICSKEVGEEPELKSCPFCGGSPKLETDPHRKEFGRDRFRVVCSSCYAGVRWYDSPDEAWLMWNGRVKE